MKRRYFWVGMVTGIVFLLWGSYLLFQEEEQAASPVEILPKRWVSAEGRVEAFPGLDVAVGTDITGKIERFFVGEGDRVEKGAPIAQIDNQTTRSRLQWAEEELAVARAKFKEVDAGARPEERKEAKAAIDEAMAGMEWANKEFDRYSTLYKTGMVAQSDLDARKQALDVAKARVEMAEEKGRLVEKGTRVETLQFYHNTVLQAEAARRYYKALLEQHLILAPISGTVIHKNLDVGEVTAPQVPLVTIADLSAVRVNAEVDETDIGIVRVGDRVEVIARAYPNRVFQGRVQEIADYVGIRAIRPNNPAVNVGLKIVQVKVALDEKTPLKLGMSVDITIHPQAR